ncbi:transmembrane protein 178B [Lates japonicus]|uniref:Transmembrane protein 178B n=1 Tax=Lates japonicus TaxID=270547 RepID=A0AAD3M5M9_LATJO|nr:transmembrane protein 178B [Lates japonicus]
MTTPPLRSTFLCLLPIPQQPGGERAQLHHCPCLLLTALVAIHPLSSCTITDGGNNIASTGHHNNRPQHPVQTTLASHHHAPGAGPREAVSAVVIYFTRYQHHRHGHGGTFLRLFGLSIERGRWPL